MTRFSKDNWDALRPLLDQALDLTDSGRIVWLAEQRKENPALAGELEELLHRGALLDEDGFLTDEQAPVVPPVSSLTGQELGPYVIDRQLGQGGMGSVWLAHRNDGRFEGNVAIKFLSLAVAGPAGEARFRREGSVLARLTHPNIGRLLDAGVTTVGQPYLVLEHIDGEPFDVWCDQRRLSIEARLHLFLQVLAAVAHANANLIVHRDLKPDNILVTGDGTVKLLDFGIAKLLEQEGHARSALTGTHEAVLTFEYAAPEQILGNPISAASDVYSLGVILYELLAGQHPTSRNCRTPAEHVRAILDTDPGPLSRVVTPSATLPVEEARRLAATRDASPEKLRRLFAGDLDNILAKALRKDPADRYPTAAAFADDLNHYLRHEPVSARPDAWSYRAGKFLRRHRVAVGSAAVVLFVLTGAALITAAQARSAGKERDQAVREVKRQHAMNAVQQVLASDSRGTDGRQLNPSERITLALGVLERQFKSEPWLVSEVMADLSGRYYEAGDRETQRKILAEAKQLATDANLPAQTALASCIRVYSFAYDEVFDSAQSELATAKAAMARARDLPNDVGVFCLDAEGQLLVAAGQADSAIPLLTKAVARMQADTSAGGPLPSDLSQLRNDLAQALRASGRTRQASQVQRQLVSELDSAGYADTDILPNVVSFLISSYYELGEFAEAKVVVRRVVQEQEAIHGTGHPASIMAFQLGNTYLRMGGELDSAELWIDRSMKDTTEGAGGLALWLVVARTQLKLDQHRAAEARRILADLPRGSHGLDVLGALYEARLKWETRDSTGAMVGLEDNIRKLSGDGPRVPPDLSVPLITAAEWRFATRNWHLADSLARRAIVVAAVDSLALTRSGLVGRAELVDARALRADNDTKDAREVASRAVEALTSGVGPTNSATLAAKTLLDSLSN